LAPLSPSVTTRGKLYDPHSSIKVPEVQLQGAVKKIGELRPELATLAVVGTPGGDLPLEIVAGTELVALRTPPPSYPSVAERRGIEGSVTIQIEIDTEGAVANAQVTHSSRPGIFEEAALRAIRRWRFRPVIRNDKPTRVKALQSIVFRLKR
jgi:TonB family protein